MPITLDELESINLECIPPADLLQVLEAISEVCRYGFGQVTVTIKCGRITHLMPAKSYRLRGDGGTGPDSTGLAYRERSEG